MALKSWPIRVSEENLKDISIFSEATGQNRADCLRALIPSEAVTEALKYVRGIGRPAEGVDPKALQHVFAAFCQRQMTEDPKTSIALQCHLERGQDTGTDAICRLYAKWVQATAGVKGYAIKVHAVKIGKATKKFNYVVGPDDTKETIEDITQRMTEHVQTYLA
ncbi:MAG: hypothetical protein JXA82_17925 [Sedimentisphaerales bacterium]|nr:hypothetical protein [Sedimentisphaerales bacterium]